MSLLNLPNYARRRHIAKRYLLGLLISFRTSRRRLISDGGLIIARSDERKQKMKTNLEEYQDLVGVLFFGIHPTQAWPKRQSTDAAHRRSS